MNRLSKKHFSLPEDFASKILDLEIKIQETCAVEDINSIVGLYSSAIEFYESIHDPSYQVYQKRLHNVLNKKNVLAALSPRPKTIPRSPLMNFNSPTNRLAEQRKVESALKLHSQGSQNARIQVKDNIKQQEDSLEYKLQNRRLSRSRGGSRESSVEAAPKLEDFEKALEQLLERLVTEKLKKTEEINVKYEKLTEQARSRATEGTKKGLKELELSRGKEIKELMAKIEIERKLEISALKNCYVNR